MPTGTAICPTSLNSLTASCSISVSTILLLLLLLLFVFGFDFVYASILVLVHICIRIRIRIRIVCIIHCTTTSTISSTARTCTVTNLGTNLDAVDFLYAVVANGPEGIVVVFLVAPSSLRQQHVLVLPPRDQKGHPVNVRSASSGSISRSVSTATATAATTTATTTNTNTALDLAALHAGAKGWLQVRKDTLAVGQDVAGNAADPVLPALYPADLFKDGGVHVGTVREIPDQFVVVVLIAHHGVCACLLHRLRARVCCIVCVFALVYCALS
mmetsp:Transcript_18091/g.37987  ORF Transcript_18091/g.37987 Transcript_18091/m.37987 type:complete len:271 (+) Transcript_18091:1179-1991(+)